MTRHVLLNNVEHKGLKVRAGYSVEYGMNVASVLTFPSEFSDVQKEYPILFQKNKETGRYQSILLLGFQKGENLFLMEQANMATAKWRANYVPGVIARGPFLIGFQDQSADGGSEAEPVIHIDLDDPRVGNAEGEPLFLELGGVSPYLANVSTVLQGINRGMNISDGMFTMFEEFNLIEPIAIKVELNNGEKISIEGNFTISEERLLALSGEALAKLNRSGFLQGAFLVLASLGNIKNLIKIKNEILQK